MQHASKKEGGSHLLKVQSCLKKITATKQMYIDPRNEVREKITPQVGSKTF